MNSSFIYIDNNLTFQKVNFACVNKSGEVKSVYKYLVLTEFEGRTISYGSSFFPPRFMRSARAINRRGKTRMDRELHCNVLVIFLYKHILEKAN